MSDKIKTLLDQRTRLSHEIDNLERLFDWLDQAPDTRRFIAVEIPGDGFSQVSVNRRYLYAPLQEALRDMRQALDAFDRRVEAVEELLREED